MMEEIEIWKDVVGWERKYKVSNLGRVWNKITDMEVSQVLTGIPQYKYVNMNFEGRYKLRRVHVVVAEAFIPNVEGKLFVDHIDRQKLNNKLENLRWVTAAENQRNRLDSAYIFDELLIDFVSKYENPSAAHSHLYKSISEGLSDQDAVNYYEEYLAYGRAVRKVEWLGKEVYLKDLCKECSVDYDAVLSRLNDGWDLWNSIYNVPAKYVFSFEIADDSGVYHWYKDNDMFEKAHPEALGVWKGLYRDGMTLDYILQYDGKEHQRQWILGKYGTIKELSLMFGITASAVLTNMLHKGMTLEQALTTPRGKVKRLSINGIYNSPKYWYESFGIDAKRANRWKANKKNRSFKETFEYFGVDTSDMVISLI